MLRPILLAADNFTAPARTPWGGRRIVSKYKAAWPECARFANAAVGESWELSFGPELPSLLADGRALADVVRANAEAMLGAEAERGSALLVKWLDAADDLSVQIHPDVDDPELAADEAGKPEAWYVLERTPGAAIYLGLRPGVTEAAVRDAIARSADVSALLQRVPVEPGDFFVLGPGLPHAVGRGVTLLEPQHTAPAKRGVTLRYWDWNRRYDASGALDANGQPRTLHVERALSVTRWQDASDPVFLAGQRCSIGSGDARAPVDIALLAGPAFGSVRSPHLRVAAVRGSGDTELPSWNTLRALTVVTGSLTLFGEFGEARIEAGRTAAIPAGLGAVRALADGVHALLCSTVA